MTPQHLFPVEYNADRGNHFKKSEVKKLYELTFNERGYRIEKIRIIGEANQPINHFDTYIAKGDVLITDQEVANNVFNCIFKMEVNQLKTMKLMSKVSEENEDPYSTGIGFMGTPPQSYWFDEKIIVKAVSWLDCYYMILTMKCNRLRYDCKALEKKLQDKNPRI